MKRFLVAIVLIAGCLQGFSRQVRDLSQEWKFFLSSQTYSDYAQQVNLPHIWNNDVLGGKRDYLRGIGNYQRELYIPNAWQGSRLILRMEGANAIANLFVNGSHVGEHRGGYTACAMDITQFVKFGARNDLWIMVNNSPQLDLLPTAGDANSYGGIFRGMELIITHPISIAVTDYASPGIHVQTKRVDREKVEGEITVRCQPSVDKNIQVVAAVCTPAGDTVARGNVRLKLNPKAMTAAVIPFEVDKPQLWEGTKNPFLYRVAVKLVADGTATDSLSVKTGFRSVAYDPASGFTLNGEPYPVRGITVHQDRAMVGTALQSYQIREDFEFAAEMGATLVRTAEGPHCSEFFDLCDEYGMMAIADLPFVGSDFLTDKPFINSVPFMENGKLQLTEMIRQNMNHPSIVAWGIFSRLSNVGDNPAPYVAQLNTLAKREDPGRMTVAMSSCDGEVNFITDLVIWDHYFGWKEGLPSDILVWLNQLHTNWSSIKSAVNYSAGASIYQQGDSLYRPVVNGNWHPERWQTHVHEEYLKNLAAQRSLWGTFAGNLFDYGAAGRSWGEGNGLNDCGLVTFDRKYRKDAFYLYKANWNPNDPFVYIAERRWDNRLNPKQQLKVYSNLPAVELFVNGRSLGVKESINGIFLWPNVDLPVGTTTVEARAGEQADKTHITILSSNRRRN